MNTTALAHDAARKNANGRTRTGGPANISPQVLPRLLALIEEGLSPEQAAARFGMGAATVRALRKQLDNR